MFVETVLSRLMPAFLEEVDRFLQEIACTPEVPENLRRRADRLAARIERMRAQTRIAKRMRAGGADPNAPSRRPADTGTKTG